MQAAKIFEGACTNEAFIDKSCAMLSTQAIADSLVVSSLPKVLVEFRDIGSAMLAKDVVERVSRS